MRKKIVAGNWKMNKNSSEALTLCAEIADGMRKVKNPAHVIIAPPFVFLQEIVNFFKKEKAGVSVAAQNCHHENEGAYTGEISASMIRSIEASHVIIGHSERRRYFHETAPELYGKLIQAINNDLTPIYCIGETIEERKAGKEQEVIKKQLEVLFPFDESQLSRCIIAYEPVWAIGTGLTASPQQAQEMHAFIRGILKSKYGDGPASRMSILYGGSCNAENASELFACCDIDGGLIGGASLKAPSFLKIIDSIAR